MAVASEEEQQSFIPMFDIQSHLKPNDFIQKNIQFRRTLVKVEKPELGPQYRQQQSSYPVNTYTYKTTEKNEAEKPEQEPESYEPSTTSAAPETSSQSYISVYTPSTTPAADPEVPNYQPEETSEEPETSNQEPESPIYQPETSSQEPENPIYQPESSSTEPETQEPEESNNYIPEETSEEPEILPPAYIPEEEPVNAKENPNDQEIEIEVRTNDDESDQTYDPNAQPAFYYKY